MTGFIVIRFKSRNKMKPIGNKVLIEVIEPEEKTASGLFIPSAKRNNNEGVVVAFGSRVDFLNIGDKIRHYQGYGTPYTHEGKKCLFLKADEIELIL